jgi:hypothetical protein
MRITEGRQDPCVEHECLYCHKTWDEDSKGGIRFKLGEPRPAGGKMPDRTGLRPTIVATGTAMKEGRRCDHCRKVVPKGDPIVKVWRSCCQRHEPRPSRRSGGEGNWICQPCVDEVDAVAA